MLSRGSQKGVWPLWLLHQNSIICKYSMSWSLTKPTKCSVCPVKTQISQGLCPVWSEYTRFLLYHGVYFTAAFKYLVIFSVKCPLAIVDVTHLSCQMSVCLTPQKNWQNAKMLVIKIIQLQKSCKKTISWKYWLPPPPEIPLQLLLSICRAGLCCQGVTDAGHIASHVISLYRGCFSVSKYGKE